MIRNSEGHDVMKINRAGFDLIKRFEGCKLKAYQDVAGVWTIGYGHTAAAGGPSPMRGMKISQIEADYILEGDLMKFEAAVSRALTRPANENQFAAMVSLCFNIGDGAFAKSSVFKFFNAGEMAKAANSFLLWNRAGGMVVPGLVKRRAAEMALFLAPVKAKEAPSPVPPPSSPPSQETPPTAPVSPSRRSLTLGQAAAGLVAAIVAAIAYLLSKGS
jgi:lysozyme